jgi:hypothetical protein
MRSCTYLGSVKDFITPSPRPTRGDTQQNLYQRSLLHTKCTLENRFLVRQLVGVRLAGERTPERASTLLQLRETKGLIGW